MFNALNRFISRLDGDPQQRRDQQGGYGFQVLRNTNLELAIEPWFDFIVGINGREIVRRDTASLPPRSAPAGVVAATASVTISLTPHHRTTPTRGSSRRRCATAPAAW